jgi:hypothetical protein
MQNQTILSGILHHIPSDMQEVLQNNPNILEKWNSLTPIQRNEWICWVTIVKRDETRLKHISRMLEELELGEKTPCCFIQRRSLENASRCHAAQTQNPYRFALRLRSSLYGGA